MAVLLAELRHKLSHLLSRGRSEIESKIDDITHLGLLGVPAISGTQFTVTMDGSAIPGATTNATSGRRS
ncbi:hypothetical protein RGCCGE502_15195 [Rhizobium grahamii CCGE 502]|uniref:Uncharacterized protein n=1 Tax=Rhizobium grahamii CCGE 502 TaxID=990285 RepID=S3HEW9_9HYPH|nr:hypothetical protein RGCCGE502_15195 [Rhizobium grahamii CCGE 502]